MKHKQNETQPNKTFFNQFSFYPFFFFILASSYHCYYLLDNNDLFINIFNSVKTITAKGHTCLDGTFYTYYIYTSFVRLFVYKHSHLHNTHTHT